MTIQEKINQFLTSPAYGVIGVSSNRDKYRNKVVRCYQQNQKTVYPVNPKADSIEGLQVFPNVDALPDEVQSISIITPPTITEQVVNKAIAKGIKHIWMQPGAESKAAITAGEEAGCTVIGDGSCILVVLSFKDI